MSDGREGLIRTYAHHAIKNSIEEGIQVGSKDTVSDP